jgi:hypothetical protein
MTQGTFFVVTGLWPIVHMRSFEAVTGPKQERWLVKTMGGLIAVIGGALLAGTLDRRTSTAVHTLGAASCAALAASDIIYAGKRRISPIYLLDAAVEVGFAVMWARARRAGAA